MRKSNGRRPVNKTDGPKKRGKRALIKSRRNDKKKIIEEECRCTPQYCDHGVPNCPTCFR